MTFLLSMVLLLIGAHPASAHEVYVLTPGQVAEDGTGHSVSVLSALTTTHNLELFLLFAVVIGFTVAVATYLKSTKPFQQLGSSLDRASLFAPDVIRIVFGISLILSASHHAIFGPELPLLSLPTPHLLELSLYLTGIAIILGIATRFFGLLSIAIWVIASTVHGVYMLTYINYLAEGVALLVLPSQYLSMDRLLYRRHYGHDQRPAPLSRYGMPITRIGFALSLIYAAINIKLIHPEVSLDVVNRYHLTHYFPFDPLFIVLGAALVEILIGILYLAGFLQRLNTVVFATFILLSLLYFKEAVWPHYLLFALAFGIFLHKPDLFAVDRYLFPLKKKRT